ncbi:MAG: ubiquitin carboxyl-terminal hydrolase family protein [Candidatus Cardinium sp.]|uniref:ubiquitin carboxyl-terminal hydrolase family protein n=1 Tax=Candidatus Cardinium sp. TP TaxID=2961955 RepID=UPI0021AEF408|nr:ubiquitin carboxyl-terminal hydrolase family protein [Candidatus Cardinium sp. TP]MCT4697119.1 ubiquitin carboxyl-terminal hydrolase [Candidatus Cardinium sp. TP]MDN5247112.1 ubiquitin carboxyl-terminal hydrolase family protein [Candidatus Cardinium sp.]
MQRTTTQAILIAFHRKYMFRKIISRPTIWLLIIVIHATVGSCQGCNRNKKITPTPASPTDTTLKTPTVPVTKLPDNLPDPLHGSTDSLLAKASIASSGSSSSGFASRASATSSGYASSRRSSSSGSSPAPKPSGPLFSFAGLENLGSTCYMNAALQVIAALYPEEAQNSPLEGLVNKINAGPGVLSRDVIKGFVARFPEAALEMVCSVRQHDVDEFIRHFFTTDLPGSITFISRILYKKQTKAAIYVKEMSEEDNTLHISFKKDENWDKYDLSQLVALNMEEFVEEEEQGKYRDIDSTYDKEFCMNSMSTFIQKHQSKLEPMQENTSKVKNYIKQIVYTRMPSKLYLQLNRFENSSYKITDPVYGTMELTIRPDPNCKDDVVKYNLHAFIQHSGEVISSGHYIAYVKREDKWYRVSDGTMEEWSQSKVIDASKTAYLLFYTKQ